MKPPRERINWRVTDKELKQLNLVLNAMLPILPHRSVANIMGISQHAVQLIERSALQKIATRMLQP